LIPKEFGTGFETKVPKMDKVGLIIEIYFCLKIYLLD